MDKIFLRCYLSISSLFTKTFIYLRKATIGINKLKIIWNIFVSKQISHVGPFLKHWNSRRNISNENFKLLSDPPKIFKKSLSILDGFVSVQSTSFSIPWFDKSGWINSFIEKLFFFWGGVCERSTYHIKTRSFLALNLISCNEWQCLYSFFNQLFA